MLSIADYIHNPPSWIVAILIAILTAHAIDKLIEYVLRRKGHNGLIPILELFIVFVLGFLVLHSSYEGSLRTTSEEAWTNRPFALVIALIFFALGSMALYIVFSRSVEGGRKRGRRA